jgi:hypothetical protein
MCFFNGGITVERSVLLQQAGDENFSIFNLRLLFFEHCLQ